jgi:multidrug efflux pump subunit AcrB
MMGLGGLSLNIMTLGALALGVGLLIDNSIVMLENIFRHKEEGERGRRGRRPRGAAEVTSAVTAATATNLAAVIPFLLISGLAALIFRELILTISFAILASLMVALTVVPMLSAQLAKVRFTSGLNRSRPLVAFDRGSSGCAVLPPHRPTVLRWRWAVLALAVVAFLGVGQLVRGLGSEFLPQVDDGNVTVNITLPPGASAEETNRITREIEGWWRRCRTSGPSSPWPADSSGAAQRASGRGAAPSPWSWSRWPADPERRRLGPDAPAPHQRARLRRRPHLRPAAPDPRLRTSASGSAIALHIQGDDLDELQRIADDVMHRVRGVPGLENLEPSTDEASPQLSIELDRERAAYLGLNVAAVGRRSAPPWTAPWPPGSRRGNQEYDLRVMFPRERFTSPEDLGTVALFPGVAGGAPIYLRDVATVQNVLGPTTILRENQNRVLRLTGDVISEVASGGRGERLHPRPHRRT